MKSLYSGIQGVDRVSPGTLLLSPGVRGSSSVAINQTFLVPIFVPNACGAAAIVWYRAYTTAADIDCALYRIDAAGLAHKIAECATDDTTALGAHRNALTSVVGESLTLDAGTYVASFHQTVDVAHCSGLQLSSTAHHFVPAISSNWNFMGSDGLLGGGYGALGSPAATPITLSGLTKTGTLPTLDLEVGS